MEPLARAAGARFEARDGWNVAVDYGAASSDAVGWADVSHLPKLELQGSAEAIDRGRRDDAGVRGLRCRRGGAWWCRMTQTRALVIGARPALDGIDVVDVTSNFAAITLVGPLAREVFARFCALDLRPARAPVGALRPGSDPPPARHPHPRSDDRYLFPVWLGHRRVHVADRHRRRRAPRRPADRRRRAGPSSPGKLEAHRPRSRSVLDHLPQARMWRRQAELKSSYDVVIIGGGSHGLAPRTICASTASRTSRSWRSATSASGASGRNTTSCAPNYKTPEGAKFYDAKRQALRGLSQDLNFNLLFSSAAT